MLTFLILMAILMALGFILAVFAGLLALSPAILVIGTFILLDILLIKLIFGRKEK